MESPVTTKTKAEELRKIIEVLKKEFPATWQTVAKAIVRVVV